MLIGGAAILILRRKWATDLIERTAWVAAGM